MHSRPVLLLAAMSVLLAVGCTCKKKEGGATSQAAPRKVGLVTDVGGRGDQSFNDSALRGLELWAAGVKYVSGSYAPATAKDLQDTLAPDLAARNPPIAPVGVQPVILQSKAQEDYEPNLQLLVDQGAALTVGVGYMLENAVETIAKRNPGTKFLLIDSPLLDPKGNPYQLPNVRTVVFREEEGSFLVGALAGLVTKTNRVGFVGGMEVPLIKKFESGFRAGVASVNPQAAKDLLVNYTGSFDNVGAGKQIAQDLLVKGADVIFQAAGSDGLGVIQAVKEAHGAGKPVYVIGVDSDQAHLAPGAVLTSMIKRVDLAVYEAARDLAQGRWSAGDGVLGLKDGGVTYAPVRVPLEKKEEILAKVEALRERVIQGGIQVPANLQQLAAFEASP